MNTSIIILSVVVFLIIVLLFKRNKNEEVFIDNKPSNIKEVRVSETPHYEGPLEEVEDIENRVLYFGNLTYTNDEADICSCWECDSGVMAVPVGYKVCPLCGKETIARDYSLGWRKMSFETIKENCEISGKDFVNAFGNY